MLWGNAHAGEWRAELYSAGGELANLQKAFSELQHFTRKTTTVKQSFQTNSQRQVVD